MEQEKMTKNLLPKELRKVEQALRRQKFVLARTRGSHVAVYKDGRKIATISGTPRDPRTFKNTLADLKRGGFTAV